MELAGWIEEFAKALIRRNVSHRTWSNFYNDLPKLFQACEMDLNCLSAKEIFITGNGKLQPAGSLKGGTWNGVYVRNEVPKGKRKKDGVPLPPSTIIRRYQFLDDKVKIQEAILRSYLEANLVREFDPIVALTGLKSALAANSTDSRKKDALIWAFKVWRTASRNIDEELMEIGLSVLTVSGWKLAKSAVFSSSWTTPGTTLENFLVLTAAISSDCGRARDNLLIGMNDWPDSIENVQRDWLKFLKLIGVAEGLQPIAAKNFNSSTKQGHSWNNLFKCGEQSEGLDEGWCSEVERVSVNYPNTNYGVRGQVWRFPGQIEYEKFSDPAKEAFCTLIFEHLKTCGDEYFRFHVGRYEIGRRASQIDSRELPTPLASFIRTQQWITVDTGDGIAFRTPRTSWASPVRRDGVPKFMEQLSDDLFGASGSEEFEELIFSDVVGLRNWQDKLTAVDRLQELSAVSEQLVNSERPLERKEYQRAWLEVVENGLTLPPELKLPVVRRRQLEVIGGSSESKTEILVTENAQKFEARALSNAGRPVLEVGDTSTVRICELLNDSDSFDAHLIDGNRVQLLVDEERFVPKSTDSTLVSHDLDWFPELIIIGNEILGIQFERGIRSDTIDRRIRSIRVRYCERIALIYNHEHVEGTGNLEFYAFEHEEYPTLILTHNFPLTWKTVAGELCDNLIGLIDRRLRSSQLILARLANQLEPDKFSPPDDVVLASVLNCDIQRVRQHREQIWSRIDRVLHMLFPIVAHFANVDLARRAKERSCNW